MSQDAYADQDCDQLPYEHRRFRGSTEAEALRDKDSPNLEGGRGES